MHLNNSAVVMISLSLLALLVACCALPAAAVGADGAAVTGGEASAWSAYLEPVAHVWSARMGYNMRGREQQVGLPEAEDVDEENASAHLKRQHAGENGGGECNVNATNVCNSRGDCVNDTCVCQEGWTGYTCHHERKSKLTAFLLEFFIGAPTGASSFYLGYIGQGVGKIVMYWSACLLLCFGNIGAGFSKLCCGKAGMVVTYLVVNLLASATLIAVSIWCLVDWIMILTDDMNDYDGYYLEGF